MNRGFSWAKFCLCLWLSVAVTTAWSADDACAGYPITPTLTPEAQNAISTQCNGQGYSCVMSQTQAQLKQLSRSALHRFLADCADTTNANYIAAKNELKVLDSGVDTPSNPSDSADRPWMVSVLFGAQFLPDYASGDASGFDKSQAFVELLADERVAGANGDHHWGMQVTLEGLPIDAGSNAAPNPQDLQFTDVADTLTAGVYYLSFWQGCAIGSFFCSSSSTLSNGATAESKWGWGSKIGLRSRESLGANQDSVDYFVEAGLHYRYNEFTGTPGNYLPRGFFSVGLAYWDKYEDYQGSTDEALRLRLLTRAEYRLSDKIPVHIGVKGNLGEGLDTATVYFAFRVETERLLGLFVPE